MTYSSTDTSEAITPATIFSTWDVFFNNIDSSKCAISSCALYDVSSTSCGTTTYTGSEISIASESPWTITAKRNVDAGYTISICVKCSNGNQNIQSGTWGIEQTIKCMNSLKTSTATTPEQISLTYRGASQQLTPSTDFVDWDTFFGNKDVTNCPITSCVLCNSSPYVSIGSKSPWAISARTDSSSGYTASVCLNCSNILESAQFEGWVITQAAETTPLITVTIPEEVPPSFTETLQSNVEYEISSLDETFTLQLPQLSSSSVSVSISGYDSASLDQSSLLLTMTPVEGDHTLEITLTDEFGLTSSYTMNVNFNLLEPEYEEVDADQPDVELKEQAMEQMFKEFMPISKEIQNEDIEETEKEKRPEIDMVLDEFTQNGQVTLVFSEDLQDVSYYQNMGMNFTFINENIESLISLHYHCEGLLNEDNSLDIIPKVLNYRIQNWTQTFLTLKLNFSKPLYVSTFGKADHIDLEFLQPQLFMAVSDKFLIKEGYSLKLIPVPTQMASEEDFLQIQGMGSDSQNAMLLTLIIPFCFMLFMSFSMNKVWTLYNMMQLITNIKNYKTMIIPANLLLLIDVVQNIVSFSLFDNAFVQTWLQKYVFGNFQTLQRIVFGQGMFVTSSIMLLTAILIIFLAMRVKLLKPIFEKVKNKLVWSSVFRSQIQTYLPTCILVFKQWHNGEQNLVEIIQCLVLVCLPIFFWFFIKANLHNLGIPDFQMRYETMYQNLDIGKTSAYMFYSLFMLRRMVVALSTTSQTSHLIVNVYINIFTSLALIKFYIDRTPMVGRIENILGVLNECFTLLSFYCMILFSDFIPDIEVRYRLGFKAIYLFLAVSFVNISTIFIQLGVHVRLNFLKQRYYKQWDSYHKLNDKMINYIMYHFKQRGLSPNLAQIECLTFEEKKEKIDQLLNNSPITFVNVMEHFEPTREPPTRELTTRKPSDVQEEQKDTPRFNQEFSLDEEKVSALMELQLLEREVEIEQIHADSLEELDEKFYKIHERYNKQIETARKDVDLIRQYQKDPNSVEKNLLNQEFIRPRSICEVTFNN